jgi:hypothetical protein
MTFAPSSTFGNTYIPSTRNFQLDEANLKLVLDSSYTSVANSLNLKTAGIFELVEVQNCEQFFGLTINQQKKRFVFRKTFSFGAILAGASLVIPHGITGVTSYTHIYGTAVTATDNRPIPHASVTANANIEIIVDATNITINNGAAGPNITSGIIVLEYLKQ